MQYQKKNKEGKIMADFIMHNDNYIRVSDHAYKRMRQRAGWNKKTADRMLSRVFANGTELISDGKGYKALWARQYEDRDDKVILYGEHVFIVNNTTLVTVEHLPGKKNVLDSLNRRHPKRYDERQKTAA